MIDFPFGDLPGRRLDAKSGWINKPNHSDLTQFTFCFRCDPSRYRGSFVSEKVDCRDGVFDIIEICGGIAWMLLCGFMNVCFAARD
jgi:hypothetical protein